MVHLDGVTIGDAAVPGVTADGAIFDSGTSLIATNANDAAAINAVRPLPSPAHMDGIARVQATLCLERMT
jgi:hypothetical protein